MSQTRTAISKKSQRPTKLYCTLASCMLLTYRRSVSLSSGKDEVGQRKVIIFYIQYVISYKLQQDVREAHNAYRNTHTQKFYMGHTVKTFKNTYCPLVKKYITSILSACPSCLWRHPVSL